MFANLLSPLESLLVLLARAAWQAALLAALVLALTWLMGRWLHPRWRFALWLVVFVRLAIPVLPPAPWSLFRFVAWPRPDAQAAAMPSVSLAAGASSARTDALSDPIARMDGANVNPSQQPSRAIALQTGVSATSALELTARPLGIVAPLWLGGLVLFMLRRAAGAVQLNYRRRFWTEVEDARCLEVLENCRRELNVRGPVRLFLAPDGVGPAACGILRPSIVLPNRLFASLSPAELRLILLHELVHIRRRDVLVDHLVTLVAVVHWFHPIAWVARHFLRRERELACDSALLDRASASEAADYGCVMLKTIETLSIPLPLPGLVGMCGRGTLSLLQRRIHMIAAYRKPTTSSLVAGAVVLTVFALAGLTDAQTKGFLSQTARKTAVARTNERGNDPDNDDQKPRADQPAAAAETQTIAGVCRDEKNRDLKGVALSLYRAPLTVEGKVERLQVTESDASGRFRLEPAPALTSGDGDARWGYVVVAISAGRASHFQHIQDAGAESGELKLTLGPAATLQGRVTDRNGQPVAGATVFTRSIGDDPLPGVCSAITDAEGRYAIQDLAPFDVDQAKPVKQSDGGFVVAGECFFTVQHPEYGQQRPGYKRVPASIDVQLPPGAILEGQVVDEVSGKPAEGVRVFVQGVEGEATHGYHSVKTDAAGEYRIGSMLEGKYNVMVQHPERACAALDSFAVLAGAVSKAPTFKLVEGGWIEGQLVDAETEKPVVRDPTSGRVLEIGLYGPTRPKSGAACQSARVDDDGRFRLRVAPGVNFPYIMYPEIWERTQRRDFYERGVEVKASEVVSLVFRVLPTKPPKNPEPGLVRLPVPLADEREAAVAIRDLGGWYQVDEDQHVIEVNMVYHETADQVRHDNHRFDTDAALRRVGAFPRLKRLYFTKGQATDDALATVEKLKDIEVLMIWDADNVSDAGVRHLTGLEALANVHIDNGQLGDESLAVFSGLPRLVRLSLQGNRFTDKGLKRLATMKQLKSLWIGLSKTPLTDAATEPLAELSNLEELDLQGSRLSDAGIAKLAVLTNLKQLYVDGPGTGGAPITDASVDALSRLTELERLGIQNTMISESGVRRLCELPKLKQLMVSSSGLTDEFREELKRDHSDLQLYVSRSETASK